MIDLHTHTNCSDGSLSPTELISKAKEDGLTHLALTDHDTVKGIDEAASEAKKAGITFYAGFEISAGFADGEVHILGIGINHRNPGIKSFIQSLQENRLGRNLQILEKLTAAGIVKGQPEELLKQYAVTGRPHIARLLIDIGAASGIQDAFDKYLGFNKPFYVKRNLPEPARVFALINECGGISSIAHPNTLIADNGFSETELAGCLKTWKEQGLNALEAFHPNLSLSLSRTLRKIAASLYLRTTGGSDFHGHDRRRPQKLGRWHKKKRIPVGIIKNISSLIDGPG